MSIAYYSLLLRASAIPFEAPCTRWGGGDVPVRCYHRPCANAAVRHVAPWAWRGHRCILAVPPWRYSGASHVL